MSKLRKLEKKLKLSKSEIEEYRKDAKEKVAKDISSFNETINNHRKWGYKEDMKKNATYGILII